MLNNLKENLLFAGNYILPISITILISALLLSFIIGTNSKLFFVVALFTFITLLIILNIVGAKRKSEIENVKNIINAIRKNSFEKPEEIKLGKYLLELEKEIRAMFIRTKNDIANLKKLEQVRTEFLGNVSHELRTPIFAIQGFIETLLDGALNDEKVNKTFLQKANQHTINLNNLLNDLIDISMIESGQMKMSFRYFNVNDFFETLNLEMKPHAQQKGLELNFQKVSSNLQLYGDKEKLKQVLVNLIMNAIKYTEKGKVEVGLIEEPKKAVIFVKDSGIGISEKDLDRIFERFYRVDKDRSRSVGGTGLGLAIVKHILEAHNSKIEVKSTLGVGSEFSFSLKK
ncbi:MAG: ATP-binding protein [Bacteroidota bacterium]